MPNVNKVILIGNLTRDPEVRQAPQSGSMIVSFTLAITRRYTNNRQETVEETCFVDVTAYQRLGEIVKNYAHKGDPIFVEGRLRYDTWEDKNTPGFKRNKLSVVCESVQLLTRRGDQGGSYAPQGDYRQPRPAYGSAGSQYGAEPQHYGTPAQEPRYGNPAPQQMPPFNPQDSAQGDSPIEDLPF